MRLRRPAIAAAAAITALSAAASAGVIGRTASAAGPPTFGSMITLGNDPTQIAGVGGEPSIQDDGQGHVYVTSPTGIATALVNGSGVLSINEATGGGAMWRSLDGGATFPNPLTPIFFGTQNGGGDTDVATDSTGKLYTADLEAAAADVQTSTDHGTTLSSPVQTGPDDDREWLTPVGKNVFLTYHDFVANVDLIDESTDGGATFLPAGLGGTGKILSPADNANAFTDCANGNLISKPVTDSAGAIYILLNCSTFPNNAMPTGAPLDRLYLAVSKDGASTFTTTLVSDVSNGGTNNGTWGHVFNQLGIDNGGNLYVVVSGNLKGTDPVQTFLMRSFDHGATWKTPINLNASLPAIAGNASVFPAVATGQAGQVAAGYYAVVNCRAAFPACKTTDYRNDGVTFQFFITQVLDATSATPTLTTTQLTTQVPHYNGICTDGLFCGTPLSAGGNRNLADFESMAVDPTGHLEVIIPADPTNLLPTDTHQTVNWFFKQNGGPLMPPGATNGNGTGNQTWVSAAAVTVPESPWTVLLVLGGGTLVAMLAVTGRRRRLTDSAG